MDSWIELARGPLFRIALTVCVLGLAYRVGVAATQTVAAWRRAGDRRLPLSEVATATLRWLLPARLLHQRPATSLASFLFHVGIIVTPLFLAGHIALLRDLAPHWWPALSAAWADVLTLTAIAAIATLIGARMVVPAARRLSRPQDVLVLLLLLGTVAAGFLAAHPTLSPVGARVVVLAHLLAGDLVLFLIPLSKIAHCALYPLLQLVFQLGWHFPPDTGRHVAVVLKKENEPV